MIHLLIAVNKINTFVIMSVVDSLIPLDVFLKKTKLRREILESHQIVFTRDMFPESISLQEYVKNIYAQGNLGACTANAICSLIKMTQDTKDSKYEPSRLFLYTMELMKENPGKSITDLGANAMDGCLIAGTIGVCSESKMPYQLDAKLNVIGFGKKPSRGAMDDAKLHIFPKFKDVTENGPLLATIQKCLSDGYPVLLAFILFKSFVSADVEKSGIMSMPGLDELAGKPMGGHEVLVVGYEPGYLIVLNSWGQTWGQGGFFKMPWDYLTLTYQGSLVVEQILTMRSVPVPVPVPVPTSEQLANMVDQINGMINGMTTLRNQHQVFIPK